MSNEMKIFMIGFLTSYTVGTIWILWKTRKVRREIDRINLARLQEYYEKCGKDK